MHIIYLSNIYLAMISLKSIYCRPYRRLALMMFSMVMHPASAQTWTSVGTSIPIPAVAQGEDFGNTISMSGSFALIGTPLNSDFGFHQGKAVIFEKVAGVWTESIKLYPDTDAADMLFGSSVLLHEDYAFVGAHRFTYQGLYSGAVFVFKYESGTWSFFNRLDCPFPVDYVFFGSSMAAYGDRLVIGAPGAHGSVAGAGAAFLYDISGGSITYLDRIIHATGTIDDKFGYSVAIDGTNLFVGSPGRTVGTQSTAGAVFVYELPGLTQVAQLEMSVPVFAQLGYGLAVSGDQLAVSAPYTTNPNSSYGGVYLFEKPGAEWADATENHTFIPQISVADYGLYGGHFQLMNDYLLIGGFSGVRVDLLKRDAGGWGTATIVKTFTESGLVYQNQYGASVGMTATDLLIGAKNLNQPGIGAGAVFPYEKAGPEWDVPMKLDPILSPSLNASNDRFGESIDIKGDYAVVGAPYDDTQGSNAGAAYVFHFDGSTWQRIAKLTPLVGHSEDLFGYVVAISDDRIVVSAPMAQPSGSTTGIIYVFEKPTLGWIDGHETATITPVAPTKPGQFGYEIRASGNEIVASHFKPGGTGSYGLVHVFEKIGAAWGLKATLNPPALNDDDADGYGSALDYDGSQMIVGLPLGAGRMGRVYVYEKPASGWAGIPPTAILGSSDGSLFSGFGSRLRIYEETIIAKGKRSAYVFVRAGDHWINATETAKLSASINDPDLQTIDVAIGRDNAILTTSLNGIGLVMMFKKVNHLWSNTQDYTYLSGPSAPSELGRRVVLSNDHLVFSDPVSNSAVGGRTGLVNFLLKQPTVLKVTSTSANGTFVTGQTVNVRVEFSHPVALTGNPTLELAMYDGSTRNAILDGAVSNAINFKYTVALNDSTPSLNYKDEFSLKGTFTVKSAIVSSESAITILPLATSPYSIAALHNIAIDGIFNPEPEPEPEPITGISSEIQEVSVFPNPVNDRLHLEGEGIISYELWSATGLRVLGSTTFDNNPLDVSMLPPGLYLLHVETANGSAAMKFVKQ